jgi:hypothetical protein
VARHSITSSARSRIDGGTARPSAVAVLRLTTISNLGGSGFSLYAVWNDEADHGPRLYVPARHLATIPSAAKIDQVRPAFKEG